MESQTFYESVKRPGTPLGELGAESVATDVGCSVLLW